MEIQEIAVVGAGQMGNGIAHVAAAAGYQVVLFDVNEHALEKAIATITKNLDRQLKKEKITAEQKEQTLANIQTQSEVQIAVAKADLIIEAATENIDLKLKIFADLVHQAKPEAIFATNTSSISITKLAAATDRPERFIGMHFMNPVPMMKLVEIIRGIATSEEVYQSVNDAAIKMGKTPCLSHDFPGFLANRILMPMINEAIFALQEGVGSIEAIDTTMMLGMGHPMGPLTLADFIGLDTCFAILNILHDELGDPKYRPSPLLRKYVEAGWYGKKVGRGFYDYTGEEPVPTR